MKRLFVVIWVWSWLLVMAGEALARDWYVSAERGKGKSGTIEKPAKDLGNIISKLEDGDRIFSGLNSSENSVTGYRLSIDLSKWRKHAEHRIVVDGLIIDNGARNRYAAGAQLKIVRRANPKTGEMPTPESGGRSIAPWKLGDVEIRNCIVMNTAPTERYLGNTGAASRRRVACRTSRQYAPANATIANALLLPAFRHLPGSEQPAPPPPRGAAAGSGRALDCLSAALSNRDPFWAHGPRCPASLIESGRGGVNYCESG